MTIYNLIDLYGNTEPDDIYKNICEKNLSYKNFKEQKIKELFLDDDDAKSNSSNNAEWCKVCGYYCYDQNDLIKHLYNHILNPDETPKCESCSEENIIVRHLRNETYCCQDCHNNCNVCFECGEFSSMEQDYMFKIYDNGYKTYHYDCIPKIYEDILYDDDVVQTSQCEKCKNFIQGDDIYSKYAWAYCPKCCNIKNKNKIDNERVLSAERKQDLIKQLSLFDLELNKNKICDDYINNINSKFNIDYVVNICCGLKYLEFNNIKEDEKTIEEKYKEYNKIFNIQEFKEFIMFKKIPNDIKVWPWMDKSIYSIKINKIQLPLEVIIHIYHLSNNKMELITALPPLVNERLKCQCGERANFIIYRLVKNSCHSCQLNYTEYEETKCFSCLYEKDYFDYSSATRLNIYSKSDDYNTQQVNDRPSNYCNNCKIYAQNYVMFKVYKIAGNQSQLYKIRTDIYEEYSKTNSFKIFMILNNNLDSYKIYKTDKFIKHVEGYRKKYGNLLKKDRKKIKKTDHMIFLENEINTDEFAVCDSYTPFRSLKITFCEFKINKYLESNSDKSISKYIISQKEISSYYINWNSENNIKITRLNFPMIIEIIKHVITTKPSRRLDFKSLINQLDVTLDPY
jgi:hypothetical protein